MSKYTTEVRFICEAEAGLTESAGFDDIEDILTASAPNIFNFPFPIFDETYRLPLERKILRHYYTREICEETVGLWKLRLSQKLNEIMPFYNQLYESELLEFNPLYDVNLNINHSLGKSGTVEDKYDGFDLTGTVKHEEGSGSNVQTGNIEDEIDHGKGETITQRGTETHTYNNTHWDYYSDTPQGGLTGISNHNYLTNVRENTAEDSHTIDFEKMSGNEVVPRRTIIEQDGTTTTTKTFNDKTDTTESTVDGTVNTTATKDDKNTKTINTLDQYYEHVAGKRGGVTYSKMLMEFRESMLNIDAMILNDLQPLFFGLWE